MFRFYLRLGVLFCNFTPTLAFQKQVHATIAVADTCLADLAKATFEAGLISTAGGVVEGRPIEVQRPTCTPDRDRPIEALALHHLPLRRRPQS